MYTTRKSFSNVTYKPFVLIHQQPQRTSITLQDTQLLEILLETYATSKATEKSIFF